MRALLDTNIVIHPITVEELQKYGNEKALKTINIKLESYHILKTVASLADAVRDLSNAIDKNINDKNDTLLLNEVFQDRVDIFISEDKNIHHKAERLGIQDRVFTINSFLEKVISEHPDLIDYNVLSVTKKHFGNINLQDAFFDSFRADYQGFDKWFNKKADEVAYVTHNRERILSFLYLKEEDIQESYLGISPVFEPKRRLKIGTFKVVSNGVRLGERFLKIIFDNALKFKVDEIYVTIFDKSDDQKRLIDLLECWGFVHHGIKKTANGEEVVLVRDFQPQVRNLTAGDIIVFYRTGGLYKGVVTTIGIVESVIDGIKGESDFILKCRKRSVFSDDKLREWWNYRRDNRPFIINFLYTYSFPKRPNMARLIELGVIGGVDSAPRGFEQISGENFNKIMKESRSNESIIVN